MSGGNRGAVTWHPNPGRNGIGGPHEPRTGGPAPTPGAGPFPRRGGVTAVGCLEFLTFRRTDHDHDHSDERPHPEVHAVADAAEAGPKRPGPARIYSARRGWTGGHRALCCAWHHPLRGGNWRNPGFLLQGMRMFEGDSTLDNILRKQPEIKGFWAGPPHQQGPGPGPRHGRPQPCPGGIGAPLPGTRIPGGMESGAHTSHAPGAGPHTGSRSVSPPRWRHRGGVPLSFSLFGGPIMITSIRIAPPPRSPCRGRGRRGRPRPPRSGGESVPAGGDVPRGERGVEASPPLNWVWTGIRFCRGLRADSTSDKYSVTSRRSRASGLARTSRGLGPVPRHGRPQPGPGGIGAPLPGTRIPGGRNRGHTSHAPGAGPHTGSRSVSPPRWRHRGGVP